jgi:hypothetical protein
MSAYITLATPLIDRDCLLAALADLGFPGPSVEVHEMPVALVGYEGALRPERAHLVIRRQHVGPESNDIGFEAAPTGFRAHISDFDRQRYGDGWLRQLHEHYGSHYAAAQTRREHESIEAARLAEIEARRREEQRRSVVAAQRQAILDKAEAMKYRVQETRQGDTIRLVLVKRVY